METSNQYSGETSLAQFFNQYKDATAKWHTGYTRTCETIQNDPDITDETLALIWYQRDNYVSSLMQGAPSQEEFERAKSSLRELTLRIKAEPSAEMYSEAQRLMLEYKSKQLLNKNYKALLNRAFSAIAPRICISTVDDRYLIRALTYLNKRFDLGLSLKGNWFELNQAYTTALRAHLPEDYDHFLANMATWQVYEDLKENRLGDGEIQEKANNSYTSESSMTAVKSSEPLNQILYGPPGTGKTYHTIEAAVKAAEPEFYLELNIDQKVGATAEQRATLQKKYQELCDAKRIRFVTFHQSYGYEEFVEGLSANSVDGQVSYDVKSGIFKSICEQATQGIEQDNDPLEIAIAALKEELEEGSSLSLSTQRGKAFDIQYHGNTTFRAFPHETSHEDLGNGYPVAIDSIRKLYRGANVREFYNPSYVKAILKYLVTKYKLPEKPATSAQNAKNFVLVIDEINRGNISKIFGELITLIEDSKRSGKGQTESIEVVLPHSGETFSVPNNLYLIGTMNTADRSLAMMDTALRRRFEFVEMMPKPSLLSSIMVKGIDLEQFLETLNQRIEVLYDHEHTLGHAFFMPVKECVEQGDDTQAFIVLKSVFQNKIIPLLEEYFFEDWNKIRLVLADNQKAENSQLESLQFISEQKLTTAALGTLFGHNHGLNQYGEEQQKFTLKDKTDSVWDNPSAYIGIYSLGQASGD
ncbi:McrB family protein [Vibrio sp. 10N]|uniref:McrB family protein n=1 Tax=Vibrio sp. 10N TaxID=3058938 RepID=UPI0028134794|nr:McrB family protein [Vibrio sp. 10N]